MYSRRYGLRGWLIAGLFLAAGRSSASSFSDAPLGTVAAGSEVIAVGTIREVHFTMRGDQPFTVYALEVEQALRGAPGKGMAIALYGGPVGDGIVREVAGTPSFASGERLLVHAARDAEGDWRLVDWDVGLLRQRFGSDGVAVAIDGERAPLEDLPCDELPAHVARDEKHLLGAMRWTDAIAAVAACAGGAR